MKQTQDEEPLLPPWAVAAGLRIGPLAVAAAAYYLLSRIFSVPAAVLVPALLVLAMAILIYFGGRFYKPFYVSREGRCIATGGKQRESCRHYIPGARLGGGCGRLREDGRCRYKH
jgi:hypothetical protein